MDNVKRFKQIMAAQKGKQNQLPSFSPGRRPKKNEVDFGQMIKQMDLAGIDVLSKPLKNIKDEEKIKEFFDNRQSYYKKMSPNQGVFRTMDDAAPTQSESHFGVTSVRVQPKVVADKDGHLPKQKEDLL